ncbi:hypothetical protein EDB85DRAFT_2036731 [Lactarius pseudohatsudake]|nr:hypothetical protein EDB85DRAFT_2036731 [Lactarius pseudohatsudake]
MIHLAVGIFSTKGCYLVSFMLPTIAPLLSSSTILQHHVFAFPNATPSSNFKSALNAALAQYKEKTGKDLLAHELADELRTCESVNVVLTVLRDQIQGL